MDQSSDEEGELLRGATTPEGRSVKEVSFVAAYTGDIFRPLAAHEVRYDP